MHRGTKNKIRNKFRMSSPFRKLDDPSSGQGGSDPNQILLILIMTQILLVKQKQLEKALIIIEK